VAGTFEQNNEPSDFTKTVHLFIAEQICFVQLFSTVKLYSLLFTALFQCSGTGSLFELREMIIALGLPCLLFFSLRSRI
jgi:hypothetical protein